MEMGYPRRTTYAGGKNLLLFVFSTVVYVVDNVHPQNTMQMVRALSEAQILFKSNVSTTKSII